MPVFFRFPRFSNDVCFQIPCVPNGRVSSGSGLFRVPVFFRFPRFSNGVCFQMPCVPNFPRRHVADVFKCSGRPEKDGRCGIEVKGYLIGWWVYFSDLLLNLSN